MHFMSSSCELLVNKVLNKVQSRINWVIDSRLFKWQFHVVLQVYSTTVFFSICICSLQISCNAEHWVSICTISSSPTPKNHIFSFFQAEKIDVWRHRSQICLTASSVISTTTALIHLNPKYVPTQNSFQWSRKNVRIIRKWNVDQEYR